MIKGKGQIVKEEQEKVRSISFNAAFKNATRRSKELKQLNHCSEQWWKQPRYE
jgi:hypothetical protein